MKSRGGDGDVQERPQPLKRTHLGLLEKHKDYALRAKDFHSKEDRIVKLKYVYGGGAVY